MYLVAKVIVLDSVDAQLYYTNTAGQSGPPVSSRKEQQYKSGCCSDECAALDLDGHGGRTFLRVLLHLTMHDYPPLVSGALHLLFRHFSQRQEVLQAFKQVIIADHQHYVPVKRPKLMRLYRNRVSGSSWVLEKARTLLVSGLRLREVCICGVLSCVLLDPLLPPASGESQDRTGQVVECL